MIRSKLSVDCYGITSRNRTIRSFRSGTYSGRFPHRIAAGSRSDTIINERTARANTSISNQEPFRASENDKAFFKTVLNPERQTTPGDANVGGSYLLIRSCLLRSKCVLLRFIFFEYNHDRYRLFCRTNRTSQRWKCIAG